MWKERKSEKKIECFSSMLLDIRKLLGRNSKKTSRKLSRKNVIFHRLDEFANYAGDVSSRNISVKCLRDVNNIQVESK